MTARVTRWWWVRHAPVLNPEGRIYGQRDLPCDVSDRAAFAMLARRMPEAARWYATPLQRTQQTAAAIAEALGERAIRPITPVIEPGLIEQSFGDWQGRTYAEIGAYGLGRDGKGHRFWLAPAATAPPGGESFVAVIARVGEAIDRLTRAHEGSDIVAVAHGGVIRAALAHALDLDPEAALAFSVETLSLTRIDRVEGGGAGHGWRVGPVNLPAKES
jgi:alpha-ribazole phosphatase